MKISNMSNEELAQELEDAAKNFEDDVADLECAQVLQEAAHRLSRVKDDELTEAYQNALNKPDSEGDKKEEKEGEDND